MISTSSRRGSRTHRRQPAERLTKSLHPAAFLIHGDQQVRRTYGPDLGDERIELCPRIEIAAEQDDAANRGRCEPAPLVGIECKPAQADHQRSQGHTARYPISTRVPVGTRSNSSMMSLLRMRIHPMEPGTPTGSVSGMP